MTTEPTRKERSIFERPYARVQVVDRTLGRLHATTASSIEGIGYQVDARTPYVGELAAREAAGEELMSPEAIKTAVAEEVDAESSDGTTRAVWRRDEDGRPFVHSNYIKGHLRDAAKAIQRVVKFYALQSFLTDTLFVSPYKIYLPEDAEVGLDWWPTHFDIYRKGRVSAIREVEYCASPVLKYSIIILRDPRWNPDLLEAIYTHGSMLGKGGSRKLNKGKYEFELSDWELLPRAEGARLVREGEME
jgi:hypothetical protein